MSIEALTFAKLTDLKEVEKPAIRLLFYVIAENTFNDTGLCKVGQDELVYQTRGKLRTVQRHLAQLATAKIIEIERRGGGGSGRLPDAIRLLRFRDWLVDQRGKDGL